MKGLAFCAAFFISFIWLYVASRVIGSAIIRTLMEFKQLKDGGRNGDKKEEKSGTKKHGGQG